MTSSGVVFDLDGVIIDSELLWERARQRFAALSGRIWTQDQNAGIIGMGPKMSSAFIREQLGLTMTLSEIQDGVVGELLLLYGERLPILPGAVESVQALARVWPLALASSASRRVIDYVIAEAQLSAYFRCTVSSEEVPVGKPAPDVYLAACRILGVNAGSAVAIEDSDSGITSALEAGMRVIAVTGSSYPPSQALRAKVSHCISSVAQLNVELVDNVIGLHSNS
jgi:HAD superfamily hydrolase (TIGR01509 family)